MTTYFRDFSSGGISDFTEVPVASGHTAPAWSVVSTDQVEATSASSHHEALTWDDINGDANRADFEVVGQFYVDSSSASQRVYSGRTSTSGSSRTQYYCGLRTSAISVGRQAGATTTSISSVTVSITSGTWCWVRFRVNGSTIRAKYWTGAAGDEPGTWDIDTTDSTYTTAGHVGLMKGANTNTHLWRKFGVGTNGDTAPTSGYSAVAFSGTVPTLNGQRKESFSESVASYFSGTETPFAYSVQSGSLPAGLSLNSSTGVISGTPTATGAASGIVIRATDDDSNTADTNSFSISIAAATVPDLSDVTISSIDADGGVLSVDVYY